MKPANGYFLGIGAQKSGTTWLHDYLASHGDVALPPFKEVHYWTSRYSSHLHGAVRDRKRLWQIELPALWSQIRRAPARAPALVASMAGILAHNDASYRAYLSACGSRPLVAGEITPAYATLPAEAFGAMERCLDGPRYILLLRNPADRFVSQMGKQAKDGLADLHADPRELSGQPDFALRLDYVATLTTVRQVIPPERLHVTYFENLFDPDRGQAECDRICDFLGIRRLPGDFARKVNPRVAPRVELDRDAIVRLLADQYRGVLRLLGPDLPGAWLADLSYLAGC